MDDRELLELAAKACSLEGRFLNIHGRQAVDADKFWIDGGGIWSPLTDDGDALRLAVKLRLCLTPGSIRAWVDPPGEQQPAATMEPYGNDEMAATRRAIVRAAAAIGRAKQ